MIDQETKERMLGLRNLTHEIAIDDTIKDEKKIASLLAVQNTILLNFWKSMEEKWAKKI